MVLLNNIVKILRLTQHDGQTGIGLDAGDGGLVGATLVDGDLLVLSHYGWHDRLVRCALIKNR